MTGAGKHPVVVLQQVLPALVLSAAGPAFELLASPPPNESRKRELNCQDVLAEFAASCSAVDVFDLFHLADLATHRHRYHCLAALRDDTR